MNSLLSEFTRFFIRITLGFFLTMVVFGNVFAQSSTTLQNLAAVQVDKLSDAQVQQIINEAQKNGYNEVQLERTAVEKGMSASEWAKLQHRINNMGGIGSPTSVGSSAAIGGRVVVMDENMEPIPPVDSQSGELKIFGSELFNNSKLSFEPNLKIATPDDYQLGPGDQLIIDIFGYTEANYSLSVNNEGYIRIPYVGPVSVSGLTIEQARKRIATQLATVYTGLKTGQTSVSISLGNIRSIKVLLMGEVVLPGSYTLPSLATVFNALYVSGGPSANGSMRTIQVIRKGQVVATLDLYQFILKGTQPGNIRLQDEDIIKVNPYDIRVSMSGEVKHPAVFDLKPNESLQDILAFAGGFNTVAYRRMVKVVRNTPTEKAVADISSELYPMFMPQNGDFYTVERILERFENRVTISGAVFRPGIFALTEGMTLGMLLIKAEGLREDAYLNRGVIKRLTPDLSAALISFNIQEVIRGKSDIVLQREDEVIIYSKQDLHEQYRVSIRGEVRNPGSFIYAENMNVVDLILMAGGVNDNSSLTRVEVARRIKKLDSVSKDAPIAQVYQLDITAEMNGKTAGNSFILEPFDEVTIRPETGYTVQMSVKISGEVLRPGEYAIIKKGDCISDVVARAGGLTPNGFAEGAVLIRSKNLSPADVILLQKKMEALEKQSSETIDVNELIKNEKEHNKMLVGINLYKILEKPGSKYDLLIEDGDLLYIPMLPQTVTVKGEVLFPAIIRYQKNTNLRYYIMNSGGFSSSGLRRKSYVVYSNGSVKGTTNILGIHLYPSVKPGSEIFVPQKPPREPMNWQGWAGIAASLASLAAVIVAIVK